MLFYPHPLPADIKNRIFVKKKMENNYLSSFQMKPLFKPTILGLAVKCSTNCAIAGGLILKHFMAKCLHFCSFTTVFL